MKRYWICLAVLSFLFIPAFVFAGQVGTAQVTDEFADDPSSLRDRIIVRLKVSPLGSDRLALKASFYNPYRCHWVGHLFFEREDPNGNTRTIARRYRTSIPGGARISGMIVIRRPVNNGIHTFVARAYRPNGSDQKAYVSPLLDNEGSDNEGESPSDQGPELVLGGEVRNSSFSIKLSEDNSDVIDQPPCDDDPTSTPPPIGVRLSLRGHGRHVEMMTAWQNRTNRDWHGDLYVDMTGPFSGVRIVRRDSNVRIPESIGFCTYDRTRLPGLGVYLVTSRALRRDGAATEQWEPSGTTEITAVCNGFYCELIRPHQRRARLTLRGDSAIHLMSDFFSEFTRVTLEASGFVFDITDLCRIEQNPHGSKKTHITVYFNTRDLPMEADEWAYYTIEIHPMPVVPEGAKLEDSLWIRTKVRESLE